MDCDWAVTRGIDARIPHEVLAGIGGNPVPVSTPFQQDQVSTFLDSGEGWDYAIGGLPFLSALNPQLPHMRETATVQKEQIDQSQAPGDHSFGFWWLKSQSSFHMGSGQLYMDSAGAGDTAQFRFRDSEGVNPWVEGQLTLLNKMDRLTATDTPAFIVPPVRTSDGLVVNTGKTVSLVAPDGSVTVLPAPWGTAFDVQSLASDGTNYWVAAAGGIWRGQGTGAAVKIYSTGANPVIAWVKQRLMLASDGNLYELNAAVSATTVQALPTPYYPRPNGGTWLWQAFCDGADTFYAAANDATHGYVYKIGLTQDANGIPILAPPAQIVELPPGETIRHVCPYLGSYVALVTSKGVRVGTVNNTYGTFTFTALVVRSAFMQGATGAGDFLYVTDSSSRCGLVRIDLSQQFDSGLYPWANDLRAQVGDAIVDTERAYFPATLNDRLMLTTSGGIYQEQLLPVDSGWVRTSRIRHSTTEQKGLRFLQVRSEGLGSIALSLMLDDDNPLTVTALNVGNTPDSGDIPATATYEHASLTIVLTASEDQTSRPVLKSYQFKSLPAQRKQRFIQLPLQCYDRELNHVGQEMGGTNTARQRLAALERADADNSVVLLQYLAPYPEDQWSDLCVIEKVSFSQTSGPADDEGWGGIVTLTLRTIG